MKASSLHYNPVAAKLYCGYQMLAAGGDIDMEDTAPAHRVDWRPAPTDDEPWKAAAVEEYQRERARRAS